MFISNVHEPESYVKLQQKQCYQKRKRIYHLFKNFEKIIIILGIFHYFLIINQLLQNINAFGIDQTQQQQQQYTQHNLLTLSTVKPQTTLTNDGENEDFYDQPQDKYNPNHYENDDNAKGNEEAYSNGPEEIQKAVCTVTAGEVRASAEAVTTKQLKGVCGSAELHMALSKLETKIYNELYALRSLMLQHLQQHVTTTTTTKEAVVEEKSTNVTSGININDKNEYTTTIATNQPTSISTATQQPTIQAAVAAKTTLLETIRFNNTKIPQMKSLNVNQYKKKQQQTDEDNQLQREDEVDKFNNTLLADRDMKLFTYYWRLENFTDHIESAKMQQIESPIFSIKGKPLQIKAYFQHLQRDFLYLQLQYATTTTAAAAKKHNTHNKNDIMMEMGMSSGAPNGGSLFKEIISNNKILFKHKISILDQHNKHSKDLVSQEFNNLDNGFLIPNSALLGTSPYIKQHALLIQLYLYL